MKKRYFFTFFLILITLSGCAGNTETASAPDPDSLVSTPAESSISTEKSAAEQDTTEDNSVTAPPESSNVPEESVTEQKEDFTEGVRIKKYPGNYACFQFETPDGFLMISDPYNIGDTQSPDVVVESHQHGDHTDTSNLEGDYDLITLPGEYVYEEAVIHGYDGIHNKGLSGANAAYNFNNIYVTDIEDIRIAHFASQGEIPSDGVLKQIGTVDVLLIQVFKQTAGKLTLEDLQVITDHLQPKILIPEHGTYKASELIAKQFDMPLITEPSGSLVVTRSMLDAMASFAVYDLDTAEYQ